MVLHGALFVWEHRGSQTQARKIDEEAYELAEAINEHRSGETASTKHITEEFADLCCLLYQVKEAYGIDLAEVEIIAQSKVDRERGRILNEVTR